MAEPKPVYYDDEKYKRFIVFSYDTYYPSGGTGDIAYNSDSLADALEQAQILEDGWGSNVELCDLQDGLREINIKETLNGRT